MPVGGADQAKAEEPKRNSSQEIALPRPSVKGRVSLEETLARRRSVREFASKALTLQELAQLLPGDGSYRIGVLFVLDQRPIRAGLGTRDVRVRARAHMRSLLERGIIPVLALGPDLDLGVPLDRRYAEVFVRLREEFGVPWLRLSATRRW